ncbi:MAG: hypothetical protein KatS3mg111_1229 [Pirellulaceae bacterium]|nr:MAG: hypothetical protein KatS3mg111_1229 [Pirellulaceae bacterium]
MFPEETEYVIRQLSHVYRVDAEARRKGLSPQKWLALHRAKSQRVMDGLHKWLPRQLDDRLVEPNSALGQAINYMLKHWEQNWIALSGLGWLGIRVPRAALPAATPLALCPGLSWRCPFGANCGIWNSGEFHYW